MMGALHDGQAVPRPIFITVAGGSWSANRRALVHTPGVRQRGREVTAALDHRRESAQHGPNGSRACRRVVQ